MASIKELRDHVNEMDQGEKEQLIGRGGFNYDKIENVLDELLDGFPKDIFISCSHEGESNVRGWSLTTLKRYAYTAETQALNCIYNNLLTIRNTDGKKSDEIVQKIIKSLAKEADQGYLSHYDLRGVDQVLNTQQFQILSILPYLLSSYLISYEKNKIVNKKIDMDEIEENGFTALFEEKGDFSTGIKTNYIKNVKSFTSKFSFEFSMSNKISSVNKELAILKKMNSRIMDGLHPDQKEAEDLTARIESVFSYWMQVFTYCVVFCKDIKGVNYTLSTALFVLSALNLLGNKSYINAIYDKEKDQDKLLPAQSGLKDYLEQDLKRSFIEIYQRCHRAPSQLEIQFMIINELYK